MGLIFSISRTRRNIALSPNAIIFTIRVWAKKMREIDRHAILLSVQFLDIIRKRKGNGKKKLTMIR